MAIERTRLIVFGSLGLVAAIVGFFVWQVFAVNQLKQKGLERIRQGEFLEAAVLLERYVERRPSDVEVLKTLGQGYLKTGTRERAEPHLTKWIELEPDNKDALSARLALYDKQNEFEKALKDSERLLEISPADLNFQRRHVGLLFSSGLYARAEQECLRFLESQPRQLGLMLLLAQIKRVLGHLPKGVEILDQVLADHPNNTQAMLAKAIALDEMNQSDNAVPLFRRVLELDPTRQRTGRYHLSLALSKLGQTEEAKKLLDEVYKLQQVESLDSDRKGQPKNISVQVRAARAFLDVGNKQQALQILRYALTLDSRYSPAHETLAEFFEKEGQTALAQEHRRLAKGAP